MSAAYDGPIFIADIDETLRNNQTKRPVDGVVRIMWMVREHGVPIIYLTAARATYRAQNMAFLDDTFPLGVLLDRKYTHTQSNELFKMKMLSAIRKRYPNASFVCLGDNMTHDAKAYRMCACGQLFAQGPLGDPGIPNVMKRVGQTAVQKQDGVFTRFIRVVRDWTEDNRPDEDVRLFTYDQYDDGVYARIQETLRTLQSTSKTIPTILRVKHGVQVHMWHLRLRCPMQTGGQTRNLSKS